MCIVRQVSVSYIFFQGYLHTVWFPVNANSTIATMYKYVFMMPLSGPRGSHPPSPKQGLPCALQVSDPCASQHCGIPPHRQDGCRDSTTHLPNYQEQPVPYLHAFISPTMSAILYSTDIHVVPVFGMYYSSTCAEYRSSTCRVPE